MIVPKLNPNSNPFLCWAAEKRKKRKNPRDRSGGSQKKRKHQIFFGEIFFFFFFTFLFFLLFLVSGGMNHLGVLKEEIKDRKDKKERKGSDVVTIEEFADKGKKKRSITAKKPGQSSPNNTVEGRMRLVVSFLSLCFLCLLKGC